MANPLFLYAHRLLKTESDFTDYTKKEDSYIKNSTMFGRCEDYKKKRNGKIKVLFFNVFFMRLKLGH